MNPSSSDREFTVVEIIRAAKGKTTELKKALSELVPICRKGEGCLQYELFEPMKGSGEFLILMRWKSWKNLTQHEASLPIQGFIKKYDGILYGEVTQTEWKSVKPI